MRAHAGLVYAAAVPFLALSAVTTAAEEPPRPAEPPPTPAATIVEPKTEPTSWGLRIPESLRVLGIESWWDVVQPGVTSGAIGLTFDDHEERVTSRGFADQRYTTRLLKETLTVRNDQFAILDPRLVTGSIELGATFDQEWQNVNNLSQSQQGTLVNYGLDMTALPESPYNVNWYFNQNQTKYVLVSGTHVDSDFFGRGITFRMREDNILRDKGLLPFFSGSAHAYQQYEKTTTTTAGQVFKQDDRRDVAGFDIHNGGLTSDLSLLYDFTNVVNYAFRQGSYRSHTTNASYSVDFGPTLNWRSDSRMNYYTRSSRDSLSDISNLDASEYLTIDHNAELSSYYSYQLSRQETSVGTSTTHNATAQVQRQFYRNFSASAGLLGTYSSLPGGSIKDGGVQGSVQYNHRLPWQGNVYANAGGGYMVTQTQVASGLVQVADAAYQVPPVIGAGAEILLKDRNIVTPSIEVVVLKGATRVAAILDIDYTLRVEGDRTSIVPLATSAVMQPNDPLNVSYTFVVSPDTKYKTISNSGSISADWDWIGVSLSHDQSNQTPFSGDDPTLLLNQRRNAGLVYLRYNTDDWQARVNARHVRYDSDRLAYGENRFDQYVTYLFRPGLQVSFSADEYRTQYVLPRHTVKGGSARVDMQWNVGAWLISAFAGVRAFHDTDQPYERIIDGELRVRRTWAKLDLNLVAGVQDRRRGTVELRNANFHIGIVRRF